MATIAQYKESGKLSDKDEFEFKRDISNAE